MSEAGPHPVKGLQDSQLAMARYLRDPANEPAPQGIEPRRLKIYQDLIYNNIEGFISSGFPVLRSLYNEPDWHGLVRLFIDQHRCHTPYFLEISQEFLGFLENVHALRPCDPPFLLELAHYEWVELGLDISEETLPDEGPSPEQLEDILAVVPRLSALAWVLSYRFPVHMIGPAFQPEVAGEPTFLVVYRNWDDQVKFLGINAAVARLLELIRANESATVRELLTQLANEMNTPAESILEFGTEQVRDLVKASVVLGVA